MGGELRRDGGTGLGGGEEGRGEVVRREAECAECECGGEIEMKREERKGRAPREMECRRGGPWQGRLQGAKEVLGELW